MPKEKLTLGIGLLMAGATLAPGNYTVRKGDTLVGIAHKLHVSGPALRIANGLGKKNTLRIGMKLVVPGTKATKSAKVAKTTKKSSFHGDTYTVRPGDNDWTIASHVGLSRKALHQFNPNVAWTKIRPGMAIRLPKGKNSVANASRIRSRYAVVMKDGTTVRRAWSKGSPKVATVPAHTRIAVLARQASWYKVRFSGGTVGWVRGDLLKATSSPATVASRKSPLPRPRAKMAYVAAVRRSPSRAQRIARWQKHVANVKARYVRIWSRQQRKYVVAPLTNGGDLVTRAESFQGVRYRWGAASRSGTDCSGFTTQVFRGEGVKLPRTSRQQATVGNKVDRNHLDKGDLIFFRTGRGRRITHVGMYVGNGKFIHASSGGGKVQVNKLSDNYYNNRFVTARRIPKKGGMAKKVEAPKAVEPPPTVIAEETTGQ